MWKRDWILNTGRTNVADSAQIANFASFTENVNLSGTLFVSRHDGAPSTNIGYGSVMDGPHVDIKVNRRVRSDSRLWFIAAVRSLDILLGNPTPNANVLGEVKGIVNIRVLGATRRPHKTGSFT